MNKVEIEIYLGVIVPLRIDPEEAHMLMRNLVLDLVNSQIRFPLGQNLTSFVTVKAIKKPNKNLLTLFKLHRRHVRDELILKFSSSIRFPDQNYEAYVSENYTSNDFFINHILIPDFEKRFYDFIVSLDISRVGAFHPGTGLIFSNKKFVKSTKNLSLYPIEILNHSLEKKWPIFEPLDIIETWNWYLENISQQGIDEISSSKLGRAINAMTYLYNDDSAEIEKLFWCMIGIEALYVSGKEGIGEQVSKKAQIFLGEIKEFKKRLTVMYNYRSAFVHGSTNFPSFFHIHDAQDSFEKYVLESSDTLFDAESLLLATLQKMAKYNLTELQFEYQLKAKITATTTEAGARNDI